MSSIKLTVDCFGYGGCSIGRHEGKVVMIKGAVMPGETVEAVIEDDKRDYFTASAIKIMEPSPHRTAPRCRYFGKCGGCNYQHIPYDLQVKIKEDVLGDCLKRVSKIEVPLSGSLTGKDPWNYRLRAQFKVSDSGIGFHAKGTRDMIDVNECLLMQKEINDSIENVCAVTGRTRIREVHVTGGDSLTALIIARKGDLSSSGAEKLASDFIERGFAGITILRGDLEPMNFGEIYKNISLLDYTYTLSPGSFIQNNWTLNQEVVKLIKTGLHSLHGKKILDLYAGAGNFTLPLSECHEVTAVEDNPHAIADGRRNLEINNIHNVRFIHSSAENYRPDDHFDIVILDPPRPGLTKKAIMNVLSMLPETIVYVSCNPATFARDVKKLSGKYDIASVRMVDFFPQTYHIEALAFLRLK